MTMVETMGIVQSVAIGLFEVVCKAKDIVAIGKVCYIVTRKGKISDDNEY